MGAGPVNPGLGIANAPREVQIARRKKRQINQLSDCYTHHVQISITKEGSTITGVSMVTLVPQAGGSVRSQDILLCRGIFLLLGSYLQASDADVSDFSGYTVNFYFGNNPMTGCWTPLLPINRSKLNAIFARFKL